MTDTEIMNTARERSAMFNIPLDVAYDQAVWLHRDAMKGRVGDLIRKDGAVVRIERVNPHGDEYYTSDGGVIGDAEVSWDDFVSED